MALVTAHDVDLSLPALIAIEHGFHTVNACLERQVHQRCRTQGQLIQNDLAAGGLRGDGHRAGKGGKANIELLGIGIAHRNGLLVGVIPLGVNRERVVPRSHQKPLSKGPVQSTQREVGFRLGINVQGEGARGEEKKQQRSDQHPGNAERNLGRIDALFFFG